MINCISELIKKSVEVVTSRKSRHRALRGAIKGVLSPFSTPSKIDSGLTAPFTHIIIVSLSYRQSNMNLEGHIARKLEGTKHDLCLMLEHFGYGEQGNTTKCNVLSDSSVVYKTSRGENTCAKREDLSAQTIKEAIESTMKDVGPFSNVLFYFGGHAGEDANGQFILAANGDHILGSELRACLSTTKHKSVSVTAVFDACHSGESLGLPYNYESLSGIIKAGKCEGQAGSIPVVQIAAARRGQHAYSNQYMVKSPNGNPDRLAYHGQLTWSFVNYLKNAEHPSIKGLVAHLDKYCDPTGLQTPLVSVSHKP